MGAAGVVIGEQFTVLEALAGLGLLQDVADPAVQLPAARFQQAAVGDLTGQRVPEHERALC